MQKNKPEEKREKQAPNEIFRAEISKILPGDVLLTRNIYAEKFADRAISAGIRKSTGGEFSHALICTQTPTFIEAVGDAVSNISVQNCFAYDLKNICLLRHKDQNIATEASKSALWYLGAPYSVRKAMASVLPDFGGSILKDEGVFCSALVAAAFSAAKCPEFSGLNPMKVTPKTLEQASTFLDVTKCIFSPIISPPNWCAMSALDGDRFWNPMREQGRIYMEYFDELQPLCTRLRDDFPWAITKLPGSFFELIEFIAKGIEKFEIDASPSIDQRTTILIKRMHEIDRAACDLLSEGKIESLFKEGMKLDDASLARMISESIKPNPDLDVGDLQGMAVATNKQIADRSQLLEAHKLYPPKTCLTLDKWLMLTKTSIDYFNRRKQVLSEVLERLNRP